MNPAVDGGATRADAGRQRDGVHPPPIGAGAGGSSEPARGAGGASSVHGGEGGHQSDADAGQHGGSGGTASDNGMQPDASVQPFTDAAIAVLGAPCATMYEWACTGHRSSEAIRCAGSPLVWMLGDVCESGSFCDTRVGSSTQGHCQPIATACIDKQPGDSVCADIAANSGVVSMRKRCGLDLVAYEDDDCPTSSHCVDSGGTRMGCACDDGFDDGDEDAGTLQCIDIDECSVDHGGCDALVTCINTPGSHDCGPCPEAHAGTGKTGCVPVSMKVFGSDANDLVYAIAIDTSGNVFVAGATAGGLDGNTNAGGYDEFIVKFDSAGEKQWTRQLGSSGSNYIFRIATDASGNVYAVGGGTISDPNGNTRAGGFILKYDGTGQSLWTREIGSDGGAFAYGVATDSSGGVYVAAGITATAGTPSDFVVLKYDSAGELQWTRDPGVNGTAFGVATDANGNVYAAGGATDTSNTGALVSGMLLVKYDASGVQQWQQFLAAKSPTSLSIATDASGEVYVAAATAAGAPAGQLPRPSVSYASFLVKYDAAGAQQWLQSSSNVPNFPGLAVDASGNVYVPGMSAVDQNGDPSPGSVDASLIKYDAAGVQQWFRAFGSSGAEGATCAAIDASGTVYVAGISNGNFDGFTNAGSNDVFLARFDATGKQL